MSEERKAAERLAVKGFGAVILTALALWAIPQLWDKLSPFVVAVPLAAMLQPAVRFVQKKLKIKRGIFVLICVLLLLGLLFGIMYWCVSVVLEQAPQLVGQSGNMVTEAIHTVQQAMENLTSSASDNFSPQVQEIIRSTINDALTRAGQWGTDIAATAVTFTLDLVKSLPYGVIYISFLAMALYFITIHYDDIRSYLPGGRRHRQDSNTTQLTNSALKSLTGYLRVQGTFALMVFVVSLICLKCFGFRYASVISIIAGLMEMIPMIGSGLLYIFMGIVFFLIGNTAGGIQVLALTGFLQLIRRILEPKLMSDSIGISPLQSLIGMFAGMRFGGILGLIGGPVAMSVLVGAVRGNVFRTINDDLYVIVQWFKRRWARAEQGENPETAGTEDSLPAMPAEEKETDEPDKAPETGRENENKLRDNPDQPA